MPVLALPPIPPEAYRRKWVHGDIKKKISQANTNGGNDIIFSTCYRMWGQSGREHAVQLVPST